MVLTAEDGQRTAPALVVGPTLARTSNAARDIPREAMIRDLQRELKRVGCYYGEMDGEWGAGSKRGLQAFLERVNSALPTADPDLIQLTLVRGYQGVACKAFDGTTVASRPANGRVETARTAAAPPTPLGVRALPQTQAQTVAARPVPAAQTAGQSVGTQGVPSQAIVTVQPSAVPFEGRMAVGAVPSSEALDAAAAEALPADGASVPPPATQATRPRQPRSSQQYRAERSWTRNFFNQ